MIGKMTEADLRIKYKFATGENATYGRDYSGTSTYSRFYSQYDTISGVSPEYAEWLESLVPNKKTREIFVKSECKPADGAVYYSKEKINSYCYRKILTYTRDYKLWLEQYIISLINNNKLQIKDIF
jgi:hypothetical protein